MWNTFGSSNSGSRKFRFVHVVVAASLAAAAVTGIGVIESAGADSSVASSYVPIVPCRLADTRSGADHVGVRASALGAGEVATFAVRGTNGNCTIPNTATGIAANVTAVNPSAASYVTIYPADASPRPTAANLNVVAGSPPTPNQVTVALSATGSISAFNYAGTVDLVIDVAGYYLPAGVGTPGSPGTPGPQGLQGLQGLQGPPGVAASGSITFSGMNAVFASGAATYFPSMGCAGLLNGGLLFVPLPVPNGATIVAVQVRSRDDFTFGNSTDYRLFRVNPGSGPTLVASFTSVDGVIDTPMVFSPLIPVSLGNTFFLQATKNGTTSFQAFCAVTVDYTM